MAEKKTTPKKGTEVKEEPKKTEKKPETLQILLTPNNK